MCISKDFTFGKRNHPDPEILRVLFTGEYFSKSEYIAPARFSYLPVLFSFMLSSCCAPTFIVRYTIGAIGSNIFSVQGEYTIKGSYMIVKKITWRGIFLSPVVSAALLGIGQKVNVEGPVTTAV